jgi:hypothetical protein
MASIGISFSLPLNRYTETVTVTATDHEKTGSEPTSCTSDVPQTVGSVRHKTGIMSPNYRVLYARVNPKFSGPSR